MSGSQRLVNHRILIVLIIFALVMGTACSLPQTLSSQPQPVEIEQTGETGADTNAPEKTGSPDAGDLDEAEDDIEVRIQAEGYETLRFPPSPMGAISFTTDTTAATERMITPGEASVEIQVVDSTGLTWTLEIPTGTLANPQTVIMEPLSDLDSSAMTEPVGPVVSGVSLEPDGLTFLKPVCLSVSGSTLLGPTFILSGTHTGAEIAYTRQDTTAAQPTAHILHFSTYFASQPQEEVLANAHKQALIEYQRLAAEAKKILKSPLDVPAPPSIPLECPDNETGQKNGEMLKQFMSSAQNPETDLVVQMLNQKTIMALAGDTQISNEWDVESALIKRLGRKATVMMDQFSGQEEKLVAVSEFAVQTARQMALLGIEQEVIDQILEELAAWNSKLIDTLIEDIQENHNYKRIPVVWMIAYNAELLGAGNNTDSFLEKLKNALQFEVQFTFDLHMPDINNITEVVVPVQFDPEESGLYQCSAEGVGNYLLAEVDDPDITVETLSFPVHVQVKKFDPCNGTVIMGIDRFGSDGDTATFTTEDGSETHPWPISRDAGISLHDSELQDGMFWFELPVQNGSATAVDETLERTKHEVVQGELTIKLIHK